MEQVSEKAHSWALAIRYEASCSVSLLVEAAWSGPTTDVFSCDDDTSSGENGDCTDRAEKAAVDTNWAASKQVKRRVRPVIIRFSGIVFWVVLVQKIMRICLALMDLL